VEAYGIPAASDREHAIEELLRSYLANDSRETVNQTLEYLSLNSRWIDLRPFDHLVSSISPRFKFESWLAASVFDQNRLQREPLDYRLDIYRAALIDGQMKLWHGTVFDRAKAVASVASSGLSDLMPLVEAHFKETRLADRHGKTYREFIEDYELYLGASDTESAFLLAAGRLADIDEQIFREWMNNDEDFNRRVLRILNYVCAEDPYTGAVGPGCIHAFNIYVGQECLWVESESDRIEMGGTPSMPGPCGSHPIPWLGSLERYSLDGRPFKELFDDVRRGVEECGFTR
jgi:hypothetical protein